MNGATIEREAERLRSQLADQLRADGALVSPAWHTAFAEVPRHTFVPVYYSQTRDEQSAIDANTPDEWLTGVYSDQLLVVSPDVKSSSTIPSLMATMLEALDPTDGSRVLEIGTGTGYNAALLSHRLGADNVVSVDIAADLVDYAKDRLASIGSRPALGVGDGANGWPGNAPYDRIIATCAPDRVPDAWLDQTRPGGRIVTPIATGIAVVDIEAARKGAGHFLSTPAFFMPMRPTAQPGDLGGQIAEITSADGPARATGLDESIWFDSDFRFVQSAALPGLRLLTKLDSGLALFTHPDGSWARLDGGTVVQGGPRQLWDAVEAAHGEWDDLGRPNREHFRLTINGQRQRITLTGSDRGWDLA